MAWFQSFYARNVQASHRLYLAIGFAGVVLKSSLALVASLGFLMVGFIGRFYNALQICWTYLPIRLGDHRLWCSVHLGMGHTDSILAIITHAKHLLKHVEIPAGLAAWLHILTVLYCHEYILSNKIFLPLVHHALMPFNNLLTISCKLWDVDFALLEWHLEMRLRNLRIGVGVDFVL